MLFRHAESVGAKRLARERRKYLTRNARKRPKEEVSQSIVI